MQFIANHAYGIEVLRPHKKFRSMDDSNRGIFWYNKEKYLPPMKIPASKNRSTLLLKRVNYANILCSKHQSLMRTYTP